MQYLSDEWITAADGALSAAWAAGAGAEGESSDAEVGEGGLDSSTTTIAYTVTGAPGGKVTYHLFAGPDGAGVAAGKPEGDPDATMELDYDTAVEVAQGETAAQVAFMQGRLKLGGNVLLLIDGAKRLEAVTGALATIDNVEY